MMDKQIVLKCRRFPPTPCAMPVQTAMGMGVQVMSLNPQVSSYDWCGEFIAKENTLQLIK